MTWAHWVLSKLTRMGDTVRAIVFGQDPTDPNGEGNALIVERDAGAARVVTGSVGTSGGWVPSGAPDNWDDDVVVSLAGARAAPGVEVTDLQGHSLSGRSLTVMSINGNATIKLNYASKPRTALTDVQYGTLQFVAATRKIIRTLGSWADDTGGSKANDYPLNYIAPGTKVTIAGSALNNGTYTVAAGSTATDLVVVEALINEGPSSGIGVSGHRPKTGKAISPLLWPATVEIDAEITKVFVENVAQAGCSMVLAVGDRV